MKSKLVFRALCTLPLVVLIVFALLQWPHSRPDLFVQLHLDSIPMNLEKPFAVSLTNRSDRPIHIWNLDSHIGYQQLSFEFTNKQTARIHRVRIAENRSTSRDNRILEIKPGETHTRQVCFESYVNGERRWAGLPAPESPDEFLVRACFRVPDSINDSSTKAGTPVLWTGETKSAAIRTRLVSPLLTNPYSCLFRGYQDLAIEMMSREKHWIRDWNARYGTVLHYSVQKQQYKVANWLLKNGANVDSQNAVGATPLHLTTDPVLITLLLQHGADVTIRKVWHHPWDGETAFESVSDYFGKSRRNRERWEPVAEAYRNSNRDFGLIGAIQLNDLDRVVSIIDESPEQAHQCRRPSNERRSPLRLALELHHDEIFSFLLKHCNGDVDDWAGGEGYPLIVKALRRPELVRQLLEQGADISGLISFEGMRSRLGLPVISAKATILHYAARDATPQTILLLLDHGADMFTTDSGFGERSPAKTPLEVAIRCDKPENLMAFLDHPMFQNADDSLREKTLCHCLLSAAKSGDATPENVELIRELIWRGADPEFLDGNGTIIQHLANRFSNRFFQKDDAKNNCLREMIRVVDECGGQIDMFCAVALGDEQLFRYFMAKDPSSLLSTSPDGCPLIRTAISSHQIPIARKLLEAGCDIDTRNENRSVDQLMTTPLHWAIRNKQREICRLLCEAGANVDAQDARGNTPLHYATGIAPDDRIVRLLLDYGAKPDIVNQDQLPPFSAKYPRGLAGARIQKIHDELLDAGLVPPAGSHPEKSRWKDATGFLP